MTVLSPHRASPIKGEDKISPSPGGRASEGGGINGFYLNPTGSHKKFCESNFPIDGGKLPRVR
ncbi:hypothetical protein D3OALGA1CA_4217 [Olavius algarvensis associated proteobacterium Delta 3]|nr:hypothetical protein D3OALGB2SA_4279 [Olavius algarvensis associated proteobacterium Delta 3]CAB5147393.1 hypothetical protein D3OALGA1CA_4217 [Olavius algarvensis associated proteobacterium Delta 3]